MRRQSSYTYRRRKKVSRLKLFLGALCVLGLLVIAVFSIIPPLIMGDMVNMHVKFNEMHNPEEYGLQAEKLSLTTEDGLRIAAYEVAVDNPKAVAIFLSGIHNPSVTAFFGHAKMLKDNGYASVLCEMRAHGESEGDVIGLGFKEYLDTKAVVDYIEANPRYRDVPIVVYGLSMGGATAINSIGQIPEIDGLISLSAYASFEDMFADNMQAMGMPGIVTWIQKPFVRVYSMIKYGLQSYSLRPKDQIKNLGNRPALLIHSTEDSQIPFANMQRILDHAPAHVETWVRDGDFHFILENDQFESPQEDQEYANHILTFLNKHFAGSI